MSWKPGTTLRVWARCFVAACAFVPFVCVHGQGEGELVERVKEQRRGGLRKAPEGGTPNLPDAADAEGADTTPLGVDVLVIRLISHQDKSDLEGTFAVTEPVMVDEELLPPEGLTEDLEEAYVGKPLSMAVLQQITKDVITAYRKGDYPLVDVYLPEQNITTGKLQLVVREARLGELGVEGVKHSNPDYLLKQIRVIPGERINSRILERDVDWINSNPSRTVDLIYERGAVDGTSDIILKTDDLSPYGAYVSYGNTGVDATGINEWAAGINISNLLGTEHSAGYSFSGDENLDNLNAHTLIYEVPLPWRHRLQLIGAYVVSGSANDDGAFPLDIDGESIQASANYKVMLPKLGGRHRENLTLGLDYKSTNTDILFGGESFFASVAEVFQFRLGYDLTVGDKLGYTRFDLGAVLSPGDVTHFNHDSQYDQLRDGSGADYWYFTAEVERYFNLPRDFGLKIVGKGQESRYRLISTEQFLAGGYRSVRGVDENIARGDSGVLVSTELIAPSVSLIKKEDAGVDNLRGFLFVDSAWLYSEGSFVAEPDQSLQTAGFGLNYRFGRHASARGSYGWVVDSAGLGNLTEGRMDQGKWHFGVTISY